jgi:nitrogen regulatory protein PII
MKRSELKRIIKPIIIECVKEALWEEGVLSGIISEVVKGLGTQPLNEAQISEHVSIQKKSTAEFDKKRKTLLEAIGRDAYNGIDLFEGTTPIRDGGAPTGPVSSAGPLAGQEPDDPGVDISGIVALGGKNWKAFMN